MSFEGLASACPWKASSGSCSLALCCPCLSRTKTGSSCLHVLSALLDRNPVLGRGTLGITFPPTCLARYFWWGKKIAIPQTCNVIYTSLDLWPLGGLVLVNESMSEWISMHAWVELSDPLPRQTSESPGELKKYRTLDPWHFPIWPSWFFFEALYNYYAK